jgi:hypothetical protein
MDSMMTNIGDKPRRWGIWQVTQHNAAARDGGRNENLHAWCPMNPKSQYPRGYNVMFGLVNNPTFRADREKGLMHMQYRRYVGKIGMDCSAGWLAVVNGEAGKTYVARFTYYPEKEYPDGASVEFWSQGKGTIITGDTVSEMPEDVSENPHLIESEILSPFAALKPGEDCSFHVDWYAANIGGDYPILNCTEAGVRCSELQCKAYYGQTLSVLGGQFGVFYEGKAGVSFLDATGKEIGKTPVEIPVSPDKPLILAPSHVPGKGPIRVPAEAKNIALFITDASGKYLGELARCPIQSTDWIAKP